MCMQYSHSRRELARPCTEQAGVHHLGLHDLCLAPEVEVLVDLVRVEVGGEVACRGQARGREGLPGVLPVTDG